MATHPGKTESETTKEVDGAFGAGAPRGGEIARPDGKGDEPNMLRANDALEIIPAPDEDLQQEIPNNRTAQWTGARPGGENPPPGVKTH
jgi:hypothetical protein